MNIFVTDSDAKKAAISLDDKRIKHMPKEALECLTCYIYSVTNKWVIPFPLWGTEERNEPLFLYNHPINKWVRSDKSNLYWTYIYTLALFEEHQYRFGFINPVQHFIELIKPYVIESKKYPIFHNSSLYKNLPVIEAYRKTMINKWTVTDKLKPTWTKRDRPFWFPEQLKL